VVVAYATSQGTQQVYGGEFVVPASVVSGLTKDTKFDLVNRHALPFNDAWFAPASKTNPPHPTRGKLDLTNDVLKRKLHAAVKEAENLRKGQQTPLRRPPVAPTISCRESQAARPEALGGLEVGNRDKPRGRGKLTLTLFSIRSSFLGGLARVAQVMPMLRGEAAVGEGSDGVPATGAEISEREGCERKILTFGFALASRVAGDCRTGERERSSNC
jgi:hypothetical protein